MLIRYAILGVLFQTKVNLVNDYIQSNLYMFKNTDDPVWTVITMSLSRTKLNIWFSKANCTLKIVFEDISNLHILYSMAIVKLTISI